MGKRKKTENNGPAVLPEPQQQVPAGENTEKKPISYVVVREGYRVSDKEYSNETDPVAISEKDFWNKVAKKHSYGEPVKIVQYDSKKHRVW